MITITKQVNLYTFKELLEEEAKGNMKRACQKAREWLREGATGHNWWQFLYENWTTALEAIGFIGPKIWFSGFGSQGDGACFDCDSVDVSMLIEFMATGKTKNDHANQVINEVGVCISDFTDLLNHEGLDLQAQIYKNIHGWHYSHSRTRFIDIDYTDTSNEELTKQLKSFRESAEDLRSDLSDAIYSDLKKEYEWRMNDNQLAEDAKANEYLFTEDGEIEHV